MNKIDNLSHEQSTPYVIRDGVFGATIQKDKEPIHLRMEVLTEENTKDWGRYKQMAGWVANLNSRGALSGLVRLVGTPEQPDYESVKEVIGFTEEEYNAFTIKASDLKIRTQNKIVTVLEHNCVGSNHMMTDFEPGKPNYIVYASRNPDFSIQQASSGIADASITLKKFIEAYNDILISVGSDFSSDEGSFHNRGISRNPHWVFEEKYSGLSMILHGFTGAVAAEHFPEKTLMRVKPVGSMQSLITKSLLPGEGYIEKNGEKIDLTHLKVSLSDPEGTMNYIQVPALNRIYQQAIHRS
jgi:hypothetical protein